MRILIYGAGVIGCWYAVLFSRTGYDTTVYARGERYRLLAENGLRYHCKGKVRQADVRVIDRLADDDCYDFVFLTVKQHQAQKALLELSRNVSLNIVSMVNNIEPYQNWEALCGNGRLIPAFPGAGGSFQSGVLKAALTPRIIQPTTFAEIDGSRSARTAELRRIFQKSRIPCQQVKDMQLWQLCHLAMVVPIADAYYLAETPRDAWKEKRVMAECARRIHTNFQSLYKMFGCLSPLKMHLFRLLPIRLLQIGLSLVFRSDFGEMFMYQHSVNAPEEMRSLHELFYGFLSGFASGK